MRVAYQAGVLAALDQAGLRFHHVDGTSGGTINLSMVLSGLSVAEICERWRTLNPRRFAAPLSLRDYLTRAGWPGLGSGRGLREEVFPHLGIDPAAIRHAEGVIGTFNVADFAAKTGRVFEHTRVDMDLLVAAVSLPVLMPAVVHEGATYTDAVWIRDSNVPEAVRRGSHEAWLVWCIGNTPRYRPGLFRQYVHMIEMAATGSLLADLGRLADDPDGRRLQLHVIKPASPLPLDPAYFFGRIDASALIDRGYQDAQRYLEDPRPLRAPWPAEITAMPEPPPSVSARLLLEGPFALGYNDPGAGAAAGRRRGTTLRAHLWLHAPRALSVMEVVAVTEVVGHVDVPGWPHRVLVDSGRAILGGRPACVVELTVCAEADRFGLRAVRGPGGLAVQLREKGDGDVIGAGIVPFGAAQALRALPTVQPANASSLAAAGRAGAGLAAAIWRAATGAGADG
jgi:predicted acylesterase/phospholipase RssA